jgi:hypothetical protein
VLAASAMKKANGKPRLAVVAGRTFKAPGRTAA